MTSMGLFLLAFVVGMALGAFYFLNLWRTVARITTARNPALMMASNFIFRMAVVLGGFYLVMAGRWERVLVAVLGFVLMREILTRRLGHTPRST